MKWKKVDKKREKWRKKQHSRRRIGRRQMKKGKWNRGLSSWNEKVALGLRKKQLAFKATTHIHKNPENWEKKNNK